VCEYHHNAVFSIELIDIFLPQPHHHHHLAFSSASASASATPTPNIHNHLTMPTYRSITLSLVSQFDIMSIPEFPPPKKRPNPFELPTLKDDELSLISVFIPTYPCSQFWIAYSIAPPYPPKSLFYFKLFLNGVCVANWGCDKQNEFKGKTMFGLYRSDAHGKEPVIQKRMICFGQGYRSSDDEVLEIKIYRCKGRKRCPPVLERYGGESVESESNVKKEIEGSIRSVTFLT
jgi:hypothetical protein